MGPVGEDSGLERWSLQGALGCGLGSREPEDHKRWNQNYSGRVSHVSSQLMMIPSSRALHSRDKRLPLDTWNQSGEQENVFGNQFSTFDLPTDYSQRISPDDVQRSREAVPEDPMVKTSLTVVWVKTVDYEFWNIRLTFRRTTWSDSKDSKCRNDNSTGAIIHNHSWFGKQDSEIKWLLVLIVRRKLCYGSKKWRWLILWTS